MLPRQRYSKCQNGNPVKSVLALVGFSLLLTACDTLSLQPLYSENKTTAEPAFLGRWAIDDTTIWRITETRPAVYSVVVVEEGTSDVLFEARLIRIGQVLFADFQPVKGAPYQIPGHIFTRVRIDGPKMRVAWIDFEWLARQVTPPSFPAHQFVAFGDENNLVLTATTAELQTYLEKVTGISEAFSEDAILLRVGSEGNRP